MSSPARTASLEGACAPDASPQLVPGAPQSPVQGLSPHAAVPELHVVTDTAPAQPAVSGVRGLVRASLPARGRRAMTCAHGRSSRLLLRLLVFSRPTTTTNRDSTWRT